MSIKLRHFNFEALDFNNKEHYYIVNRLASEQSVKDYISYDFKNFVKEPKKKEDIVSNGTYIIKKDDDIIGLVGTKELDNHGILELWMALNPSDSGHGNGTKILEEITPYLIEKVDNLNDIKFLINKNNIASKKASLKAGYNYVSTDENGIETYRYFGK